jgi:hypothetical protein
MCSIENEADRLLHARAELRGRQSGILQGSRSVFALSDSITWA